MFQVQPYKFGSYTLRTLIDNDGEPLFVAKDIAVILGYRNTHAAIAQHCKGVVKRYPLETNGGTQEIAFIREPDLWRLIVGSHLPEAKRIEAWIFEEVLPSIRKRGSYSMQDNHQSLRELIREEMRLLPATIVRRVWGSPLTQDEIRTIKRLSANGFSNGLIAREIGCSQQAVARKLR